MQRRDFITLLGGAAAAWPLAARAQQPDRVRRIGALMAVANNALGQARARAFQQQLERLGWTEGRNIVVDFRWSEGRSEPLAAAAAELVRLKVDVIVTGGTPPAAAAKEATSLIPIVFTGSGDPVATGLVPSLEHPGGNVTGLSSQNRDLAGKRVELLRQIVPGLSRLGILTNVDNISAALEMREVEAAAAKLRLDVVRLDIRRPDDIAPALRTFKGPASAIYVVPDALTATNARRINTIALGQRLPTMHGSREQIEAAGLTSYGADLLDLYRRAADYVDKILRGAKPGDLPVEQPTKFNLVINLTTAEALDLEVTPSLLALADEVIE
jgi:putative ABC transport system substrate-binding protein